MRNSQHLLLNQTSRQIGQLARNPPELAALPLYFSSSKNIRPPLMFITSRKPLVT